MRLAIAAVLACFIGFALPVGVFAAVQGSETASWHKKDTAHFSVLHESSMAPQAVSMELEKIYSKLRMHMAAFAPWMAKQKTKIYIYKSQESYLASSFNPPPWSEALALLTSRAVVIYDKQDLQEMRRVLTHELSHLFFGSFFMPRPKALPVWLDEGMATNMEDAVLGQRYSVLLQTEIGEFQPFDRFIGVVPGANDSAESVNAWYQQAFGSVRFMYNSKNRLQFSTFCRKLLAGRTPEQALWEVYKIRGWQAFDSRWRTWLAGEQAGSRGENSRRAEIFIPATHGFSGR